MTGPTDQRWFTDDHATLGDRITAARERSGMTAAVAARRLGVRTATLEGWEEDRAEPRANRLQMLAGLLGVSLRWLMTGEGEGPAPDDGPTPGLRILLTEMRAMAAEQARLADRLARSEKRLRQMLEAEA